MNTIIRHCGRRSLLQGRLFSALLAAVIFWPVPSPAVIQYFIDKTYYEVLGVRPDASSDDIKRRFRLLARESHPDLNPGDKIAEQKFADYAEAYSVVGDEEKRQKYDELTFSQQRSPETVRGFYNEKGEPAFDWQEPPVPKEPWNLPRSLWQSFLIQTYFVHMIDRAMKDKPRTQHEAINNALIKIQENQVIYTLLSWNCRF